jgi:hypothetical protein
MSNLETIREIKITKETEKAVVVEFDDYESYNHVSERCNTVSIWLPKSQIEIKEGFVTKMAGWLASKNGIETQEAANASQARQEAGFAKYESLVAAAKEAGLKVRSRMKASTILKIAAKAEINLVY